jgi:hypothetical protein
MSVRSTLLGIGGLIWLGGLACWLRARGGAAARRVAVKQVLLFVFLSVPFLVAGAFYTASSYPGEELPPSTPSPIAAAATPALVSTPSPALPAAPPDYAAAVLAAQRAAVARYPALGIAQTPFNRAFLTAYRRMQRTEPDYFDDPQWPLRLADEVAGELATE